MKIVVCNTGPILHLREIHQLSLLDKAGTIIIPKRVDYELRGIDLSWKKERPHWISIRGLPHSRIPNATDLFRTGLLDMGEAEAVVLAQHLRADWFLTDDTAARTLASVTGLEVHGTLGVLLWAAALKHLDYDGAKTSIKNLSESTLWISRSILEKAYKALDEIFGNAPDV